ncbi:MAG: class I SAM-dependent methyltransferase [bacterium]|nr:class I SAM-dependent methyltransferase [bacterium]
MNLKPTLVHDDQENLAKLDEAWTTKPILRRIYTEQFYGRLLAQAVPNAPILEIGSGAGRLREVAPNVIRSDILYSPGINCVVDAHELPFATSTFGTIIGLDVLHHFSQPLHFLTETARVLRPGGRLVLVEPWITPFSRFIYTYLHQEETDLSAQPWRDDTLSNAEKLAFDGNPAIPYLLLERGHQHLRTAVPALRLCQIERFSLLTYLLSLGFKPGSLLPLPLYPLLYQIEEITRPAWARLAALRALIVWEKH